MIDMHAHICSYDNPDLAARELSYRSNAGIFTFFSTGTPLEYRFMRQLLDQSDEAVRSFFRLTFGIHPWYADQWDPRDWSEYYKAVPVIGEIGMDNLWCDVPLDRQQRILEKQLILAADLQKPVVLHTKGCEARIAQIVRDYPYPILIHWYSGDAGPLHSLIDLGCYFTLGPDTGLNMKAGLPSLLLENVPADHLFTETDGLSAIQWAYEEAGKAFPKAEDPSCEFSIIEQTLDLSATCIARLGSVTKDDVFRRLAPFE